MSTLPRGICPVCGQDRQDNTVSAEHGWTRHGHRCCDQATGHRPSRVARCGGPAICRECAADAAVRHSPGSGTYEPDPDLSFVATAGGNADEPAVLLLPEHLAEVAAFVRSQRAVGWREAIEALRDTDDFASWSRAGGRAVVNEHGGIRTTTALVARFLESLAPKETQ